jgi:hypothetical protein
MGKIWNWFRDSQRTSAARRREATVYAVATGRRGAETPGSSPTKVEGITLGASPGGGHLVDELSASYTELTRLFGRPNMPGDGYKTTTEWSLEYAGHPISVYDYKATSLYDDEEPSPAALRRRPKYDWHVGSDGSVEAARGIQLIKNALKGARSRKR